MQEKTLFWNDLYHAVPFENITSKFTDVFKGTHTPGTCFKTELIPEPKVDNP